MSITNLHIGTQKARFHNSEITGEVVMINNESYYHIENYDMMRPFFMSIVSNSDHWMFISSNGGVSAGRKNSDNAIFPYYTDDKITELAHTTGSKTIIRVKDGDTLKLWEPFSDRYTGIYNISRDLYKSNLGNKIIFQEHNKDLNLTFKYQWNSSDIYGFIKKSELINHNEHDVHCEILDGMQNILPSGVGEDLQKASSNLVDAYKRTELQEKSGIGIIALSAIIVDKAEPSEALKANLAWSIGVENPIHLVSSLQLNNFRKGLSVVQETDVKAEKGAYFTVEEATISSNTSKKWMYAINVNQSMVDVAQLAHELTDAHSLQQRVEDDIKKGSLNLRNLTAAADGLQVTDDALTNNRHFANTLFNIMRGGIFDDNYRIEKDDFLKYIKAANNTVYKDQLTVLESLPSLFNLDHLHTVAATNTDLDFKRLCIEYLPLKFSRRHGDPSRPWNKFSINTRSEVDGSKILDYEGNWRDIFQNWEALAHSYPEFMEGMIHKFLNASTFDGYNPYRVTKGGFDWEVIEEDDPWSYIGYWGDHQIIYLLKFLEFIKESDPVKLKALSDQELFVYANVPYTIKPYEQILENSKDTIDFNHAQQELIEQRRATIGVDGALVQDANHNIYRVNFIEKLLATVLAKVSNLIPEAGIWLNTQRPEWNDANNALVGNGVSMVTLYYLRRFLSFMQDYLAQLEQSEVAISAELQQMFSGMLATLQQYHGLLSGAISDQDRRTILDGLSQPASDYRERIYSHSFSGDKTAISISDISSFVAITLDYLDHSIVANRRNDGMYHAYNLMTVEDNGEVSISYLPEMLEGQVAVLSAGSLTPEQSLEVMDGLKASALFRPDQYSYILYPEKQLLGFEEKNIIPQELVSGSKLLTQLLADGNHSIVVQNRDGEYHFNSSFNNVKSLKKALNVLEGTKYESLATQERKQLERSFETVFNHKAFTGRSGTFFGYEGLGSIYWHMVSKLVLAVQESSLRAMDQGASDEVIGRMLDHYYEMQAGIGVHKSPELYGAVPTDPYSHTPATKGAQQPGMTGQVKEDILSRIGELGAFIKDGKLTFKPRLLRKQEFLSSSKNFTYVDVNGETHTIELSVGSLAFTYAQVPVIYKMSSRAGVTIHLTNGETVASDDHAIDTSLSKEIFNRTHQVKMIEVNINDGLK